MSSATRAVCTPLTTRVLEAIERLGYHLDIIARSRRRRETPTLGLLEPSIEIPFFTRVAINKRGASSARLQAFAAKLLARTSTIGSVPEAADV
jgi:DNA-binding LacI/PurR family transcriptional regulator